MAAFCDLDKGPVSIPHVGGNFLFNKDISGVYVRHEARFVVTRSVVA